MMQEDAQLDVYTGIAGIALPTGNAVVGRLPRRLRMVHDFSRDRTKQKIPAVQVEYTREPIKLRVMISWAIGLNLHSVLQIHKKASKARFVR